MSCALTLACQEGEVNLTRDAVSRDQSCRCNRESWSGLISKHGWQARVLHHSYRGSGRVDTARCSCGFVDPRPRNDTVP